MWLGWVHISNGRSDKKTFLIVDAQSVKNTDTSEHKGDDAYMCQSFADGAAEILAAKVELAKCNELHTLKVMSQRWIVERSFGWFVKCRKL